MTIQKTTPKLTKLLTGKNLPQELFVTRANWLVFSDEILKNQTTDFFKLRSGTKIHHFVKVPWLNLKDPQKTKQNVHILYFNHSTSQPFTQLICYSQVAQHSRAEDFTQSQDCCVHLTLRWDGAIYNKGWLIEVWNRRKKIETFSNSWGWSCRTSYFAQVFCKATGLGGYHWTCKALFGGICRHYSHQVSDQVAGFFGKNQ